MICTFFGHKNTPNDVKDDLKDAIVELIETQHVKKFYVGNNGNFDFLVQNVFIELQQERKDIEFYIVLSFLGERALTNHQSITIFPEELECIPPKFAISKRNDWMLKHSSFAIFYVEYSFSNSFRWMQKAEKRGIIIQNLAK